MPTPFNGSSASGTVLTGNNMIDSLLSGTQWGYKTESYSFVTANSLFATSYPGGALLTGGAQGLSAAQQAVFTALASAISNYANITLTPVADNASFVGDLRVGFSTSNNWDGGGGTAYYPSGSAAGGDIWINPGATDLVNGRFSGTFGGNAFALGSFSYQYMNGLLLAAVGLKSATQQLSGNRAVIDAAHNGLDYTLMGDYYYAAHPEITGLTYYPTTPMVLDIAALQAMYGANTSYNAGDTAYSFTDAPGQYYNQTIWDGGGVNTIAYSGSLYSIIDLREGHGSSIGNDVLAYGGSGTASISIPNVWIAYGTQINKAEVTGTAPVDFLANDNGNTLTGGAGADNFLGGAGADVVRGNASDDWIDGGGGIDVAVYGGKLSDYIIKQGTTAAAGMTVTDSHIKPGNDGNDILLNVERLQFSDLNLALDMGATQAGGKAVLTLGAALGAAVTHDPGLSGLFLKFFSSGASVLDGANLLVNTGLMAAFAGGADNASFVKFIYANVNGQLPDTATLASLVAPLNAHTATQAQWLADMALSPANQQHVGLTGLAGSGWMYLPA